jgi:hypothetical protein
MAYLAVLREVEEKSTGIITVFMSLKYSAKINLMAGVD